MIVLILALLDGGSVHLEVPKADRIELTTKYGALSIPLADIAEIAMGAHVADSAAYAAAAQDLGDSAFQKRDVAAKFLATDHRGAYRFLMAVKDDPNLERAKRAQSLLASSEVYPLTDRVTLWSGEAMEGEIKNKNLVGTSRSLGKLTVGLHVVGGMRLERGQRTLTLQADKMWHKAGRITGRVRISAEGNIDLWPQGPGQYVCGPRGHGGSQNGPNNMGALIGRINGREFFIGDSFVAMDAPV